MLKVSLIRRLLCAFVVTIALGSGHSALADPILPGFDLFTTQPGTFANIMGIPVFFRGTPVVPGTTADTVVERLQGIDPFPIGGMGTIDIVLRQLSLQSIAPVNINGTFFDVFATATPNQDLGTMTIFHSTPTGGTFNSILPVNALLTLIPVGGGAPITMNFSTTLRASCTWSHNRPPNYPNLPNFPSGGFFPTILCVESSDIGGPEVHVVAPAENVPEPATLLLLASGLAGFAGFRRKQIRSRKQ